MKATDMGYCQCRNNESLRDRNHEKNLMALIFVQLRLLKQKFPLAAVNVEGKSKFFVQEIFFWNNFV